MSLLSKKLLRSTADELNHVVKCDPPIDITNTNVEQLIADMREAIELIIPSDVFTPESQAVIDEISKRDIPDFKEDTRTSVVVPSKNAPKKTPKTPPAPVPEPVTDVGTEPTEEYTNQARETKRTSQKPRSGEITYYQTSSINIGLKIGSTVEFTSAANSRIAPSKELIGKVINIKINPRKTPEEVVGIETEFGIFYKYSRSVVLVG